MVRLLISSLMNFEGFFLVISWTTLSWAELSTFLSVDSSSRESCRSDKSNSLCSDSCYYRVDIYLGVEEFDLFSLLAFFILSRRSTLRICSIRSCGTTASWTLSPWLVNSSRTFLTLCLIPWMLSKSSCFRIAISLIIWVVTPSWCFFNFVMSV